MALQKKLPLLVYFSFFGFLLLAQTPERKDSPYQDQWNRVNSFESKGLPQSALTVTDSIYQRALADKNEGELLKAMIHHIKFNNQVLPDSMPMLITWMENRESQLSPVSMTLVKSMLARLYNQYYQEHRWQIMNRTPLEHPENQPMETWDYAQFMNKISKLYNQSVEDTACLMHTPVADYLAILEPGNADRKERPTLYDFLINRAIDFYGNTGTSLHFKGPDFLMENQDYLATVREFVTYNPEQPVPENPKYRTFRLY